MSLNFSAALRSGKPRRLLSKLWTYFPVMGLDKRGKLWLWGEDDYGVMGEDLPFPSSCRYVPLPRQLNINKTFCKITDGYLTISAIDNYGQVWSWGRNQYGEAGVLISSIKTPVSIDGQKKTFCEIRGTQFVLALDQYGQAWGWGRNSSGYLGDNTTVNKFSPVSVLGQKKTFCKITTTSNMSGAIDNYGQVWTWGWNGSGHLGIGTTAFPQSRLTPVSIAGAKKTFCQINTARGIDKYGQIWSWGTNGNFELGNNSTLPSLTPVSIGGAKKTFCKIFAYENVAIDQYGDIWFWGLNLPFGIPFLKAQTPRKFSKLGYKFCEIVSGNAGRRFMIDTNGRTWMWGGGTSGTLANQIYIVPTTGIQDVWQRTPVGFPTNRTFCKIALGRCWGNAIDNYGKMWHWGTPTTGNGWNTGTASPLSFIHGTTYPIALTPVCIKGQHKTFCNLVNNFYNTAALDKYGQAWVWGLQFSGSLGNNTSVSANAQSPVSVGGQRKTFCKIGYSTGYTQATGGTGLCIDKYGQIWGWGVNLYGNIGDNSTISRLTPVSIGGVKKTFCEVFGNFLLTSAAIDKYGQVWSWGRGDVGQLGNNTVVSARTPVSLGGNKKTFCKIAGGQRRQFRGLQENFTLAIDKDGQIWGWGSNVDCTLGINTTYFGQSQRTPVSIGGTRKTFCKIAGGYRAGYAIDKYGQLWGWGYNYNCNLGMGEFRYTTLVSTYIITPTKIGGAQKTFCEITAQAGDRTDWLENSLAAAIDHRGRAWAWGSTCAGNGTNFPALVFSPVPICNV
jgi:alpha-tubulin suppressor-like RCC1 family protein